MNDSLANSLFACLMQMEGRAEIVNGEIVILPADEPVAALAKVEILVSLRSYAKRIGQGRAIGGTVVFRVNLPNRESFSPDAAFVQTERDGRMGAIQGAPLFAVEVRSENDYGPRMEERIQQKISDYFAAGTLAVWDVDLLNENVITLYTRENSDAPQLFKRGEIAHAGAALPDWTMPVDEIFA